MGILLKKKIKKLTKLLNAMATFLAAWTFFLKNFIFLIIIKFVFNFTKFFLKKIIQIEIILHNHQETLSQF